MSPPGVQSQSLTKGEAAITLLRNFTHQHYPMAENYQFKMTASRTVTEGDNK